MTKLLSVLAATTAASFALAQIGGGGATFGNERQVKAADAARAAEQAKRNIPRDNLPPSPNSIFIEANVLLNVPADEYVAVFAASEEGKTIEEARAKMDATINGFTAGIRSIAPTAEVDVDFVAQNRLYGYEIAGDLAKEVLTGFEVKKSVSVKYRDKRLFDRLVQAASKVGIFDLVKVDYVVRDIPKIQSRLMAEAAKVVKRKAADQEGLLGVTVGQPVQVYPEQFGTYYPTEMYSSYVAQESEQYPGYRPNMLIQRLRKPRTFYYDPLDGKTFDHVVNPGHVEPMVQFTLYLKVRYEKPAPVQRAAPTPAPKPPKKAAPKSRKN